MADDQQRRMKGDASFQDKTPPSAAYIKWLLAGADALDPRSPLHRLGTNPGDASPGDHNHDGRNSARLFNPAIDIVTGDISVTGGQRTAIKAILTALKKVGLTDNTTG